MGCNDAEQKDTPMTPEELVVFGMDLGDEIERRSADA
jgi:hypothetical protein